MFLPLLTFHQHEYVDGLGFLVRVKSAINDAGDIERFVVVAKNLVQQDYRPDPPYGRDDFLRDDHPDDDNDPKDESAPAMTADLFDEPTLLADAMRSNLEADPGLGDYSTAATGGDPAPDYSLTNDSCLGAFGGPSGMDWTTGWTAFPTGAASSN